MSNIRSCKSHLFNLHHFTFTSALLSLHLHTLKKSLSVSTARAFHNFALLINFLVLVRFIGARHIQYVLLFLLVTVDVGIRNMCNVAILAIVSDKSPDASIPTYPEWSDKKNIILSSYSLGYICLQVIAGQVAKNYGPKYFLFFITLIGGLFSILTPLFAAHFGYQGVIACRVIQGLAQGFVFPSTHNLIGLWAPLCERARVTSSIYAAGAFGSVLSTILAGYISETKWGWPVVFYLYGGLFIAWSVVWLFVGSNSPQQHRSITLEEIDYIRSGASSTVERGSVPTPWKSILCSLPFWAIIIMHAGCSWATFTLLTETPSYMEKVLGYDISVNSIWSSLPQGILFLTSFIMSSIADHLINNNITSVGTSRKIFNSIGGGVLVVSFFALMFVSGTDKVLTNAILIVGGILHGAIFSGFVVNHIDISPVHSGTLMAITNTVSTICAILAPLSVDLIKSVSGYEEGLHQLTTETTKFNRRLAKFLIFHVHYAYK